LLTPINSRAHVIAALWVAQALEPLR
jgi:hypothetical protein